MIIGQLDLQLSKKILETKFKKDILYTASSICKDKQAQKNLRDEAHSMNIKFLDYLSEVCSIFNKHLKEYYDVIHLEDNWYLIFLYIPYVEEHILIFPSTKETLSDKIQNRYYESELDFKYRKRIDAYAIDYVYNYLGFLYKKEFNKNLPRVSGQAYSQWLSYMCPQEEYSLSIENSIKNIKRAWKKASIIYESGNNTKYYLDDFMIYEVKNGIITNIYKKDLDISINDYLSNKPLSLRIELKNFTYSCIYR